MTQRGLVGQVHCVSEIRAALRDEAAHCFGHLAGLMAGNAVHPQAGSPRESHNAEFVLGLELRGQNAQRLVNDLHAVGALHRARIVEEQYEVQRTARLAARSGGLDGKAQQITVVCEGIARSFPGERDRHARRRLRVAVIEGVDELFAPHRRRFRHDALLQASSSKLEGDIADVEREGGVGVVASLSILHRFV